jgi:ubiquinone/menaquinone biosynthesis C-methylase UbiE
MLADWEARAAIDPLYHINANRRTWTLESFYATGRDLVARFVDPALERLEVDPAGMRVLEIGCGMGRLFEALSQRFDEVYGIDISPTMLARGREHCPVEATWLQGDGRTLAGVDDASVDHVLAFEVFQHIPEPDVISSYLAEIHRVLRPNGTFTLQLRRGSDSLGQAVVRRMPRPMRVAAARALRAVGYLPVIGDIDTWIGCIVHPDDAITQVHALGFADVCVVSDEIHASNMGYLLLGRKPASEGPSVSAP